MNATQWKRAWPNHCGNCLARTDSANPCQECLGGLICPRCGRLINDEGEDCLDPEDASIPCTHCGWVEGQDMGCPLTRAEVEEQRAEEQRQRSTRARRLREEADALEGATEKHSRAEDSNG